MLGSSAEPGHVFLLVGELGAGKTCLAQGILWGLGVDEFARSPTFVLVSEHRGRLTMYHIDLFRLEGSLDLAELGMDEYLEGQGLCVVEWADRAPGLFQESHLKVGMERLGESERRITISASSPEYGKVLEAVKAGLPTSGA